MLNKVLGFLFVLLFFSCSMEESEFSGVLKGEDTSSSQEVVKEDVPSAIEILSVADSARLLEKNASGFVYCATSLFYPSGSGISLQATYPDGSVRSVPAGEASFSSLQDSSGMQSVTLTLGKNKGEVVQDSYSVVLLDSYGLVPVLSVSGLLSPFSKALNSDGSLSFDLESGAFNAKPFSISSTELSYKDWKAVYDWATSSDRGQNIYTFRNAGAGSGDFPVTNVSLCDAKVWCNAASEKAGLSPVYCNADGSVIRDSGETARLVSCTPKETGGYRLPTAAEWELAARGGLAAYGSYLAYSKKTLSGVEPRLTFDVNEKLWQMEWAGVEDKILVKDYLVFEDNSPKEQTSKCASKKSNILGLFDMSGNVAEWVDSQSATSSVVEPRFYALGGSYYDSLELCKVQDRSVSMHPSSYNEHTGFRVVR